MLILALDTSSPAGSLALLRDANVLSERVSTDHEPYSASVLRETRELLDGARISLEEIDLFAVDAGPGSFTGLRVGLTTVKGWAEVLGKPVAAVSGLEAMAAQVSPSLAAGSLVAAVMDARRGQIFGAVSCSQGTAGGFSNESERRSWQRQMSSSNLCRRHLAGRGLVIACVSPELIELASGQQWNGRALTAAPIEVVSSAWRR